jgi:curved DNA-binding protein
MSASIPFVGDHYDTLGVAKDASAEEIKKAFRKLARECHPDVAGNSPETLNRFNKIRSAYEELSDPERRAAYDAKNRPRAPRMPGREGRMPGGFFYRSGAASAPAENRSRMGGKGNNIDLEDLFGDFGGSDFGFGDKMAAAAGEGPPSAPPRGAARGSGRQPGRDITMSVEVPASTAELGGTVTLHYPRLRLGEDGQSLFRYDELHDLRVPPGTQTGHTLRVDKFGDAGNDGTFGDLVCDVRVVADPPGAPGPRRPRPEAPRASGPRVNVGQPAPAPAATPSGEVLVVPITVVDALLGGRIEVDTPAGRVRVGVPPCTDSGTRLRLKGKGAGGADLFVELKIVTPRSLDAESRELIERFAALNPMDRRG